MTSNSTPIPFFIAFSGKKQVGKDLATSIARTLLEHAGKRTAMTAFASPLKEMCIDIIGLDRNAMYGSDEEKNAPSHVVWDTMPIHIREKYAVEKFRDTATISKDWPVPRRGQMTNREVLQVIGTDIFRAMIDNDVWAKAPFNKDWGNTDVVILTDCRFPNEKQAVEDNGGVVIRLERDTGFQDNHPSEISLDDAMFMYTYINDGTIEKLAAFVGATLINLGLL